MWKRGYHTSLETTAEKMARLTSGRGNDKGVDVGKFRPITIKPAFETASGGF